MLDDTPRLLCYHKLGSRTLDAPLWIAVVTGSPGKGGSGIVIAGYVQETYSHGQLVEEAKGPGDPFSFSANNSFSEGTTHTHQDVWGLDAVPDDIAAAWLKFHHLGKIS